MTVLLYVKDYLKSKFQADDITLHVPSIFNLTLV